jgi:hypothetical protein
MFERMSKSPARRTPTVPNAFRMHSKEFLQLYTHQKAIRTKQCRKNRRGTNKPIIQLKYREISAKLWLMCCLFRFFFQTQKWKWDALVCKCFQTVLRFWNHKIEISLSFGKYTSMKEPLICEEMWMFVTLLWGRRRENRKERFSFYKAIISAWRCPVIIATNYKSWSWRASVTACNKNV